MYPTRNIKIIFLKNDIFSFVNYNFINSLRLLVFVCVTSSSLCDVYDLSLCASCSSFHFLHVDFSLNFQPPGGASHGLFQLLKFPLHAFQLLRFSNRDVPWENHGIHRYHYPSCYRCQFLFLALRRDHFWNEIFKLK